MIDYQKEFQEYLVVNRSLSLASLNSYLSELDLFSYYCSKRNIKLCEVNSEEIRDYLKYLSNDEQNAKNTIIHTITVLRSFYIFMAKMHYQDKNPMLMIDLPIKAKTLPTFITLDEFNRIMDCIPEDTNVNFRNHLIVEMLYDSGFRISELLNLTLNSIELEARTIKCKGKGSKERMVMIGDYEKELLIQYLDEIRPQLVGNHKTNLLFVTNRGGAMDRSYVFKKIKEYALAAGISKNISPHTFRHSFATSMLENDADLRTIQTLLGHGDISTTQIYTHVTTKHLRDNYNKYNPLKGLKDDNKE